MVCRQPNKANKEKCHLLISGSENITVNVDGNIQ